MGAIVIAIRLIQTEYTLEKVIQFIEKLGELLKDSDLGIEAELIADVRPELMVLLGESLLYAQLRKLKERQEQVSE